MVVELRIKATKKYGVWLAKHLSKEHPKTHKLGKIKFKTMKGGSR